MHGPRALTEMNRLVKLSKNQKGFTLIEVLIVILLTGIMSAAITGVILYVLNVNMATANRMTAVRQVRNVGFWVNPDFQMAEDIDTADDVGTSGLELITLGWTDLATADEHKVVYTLEDMSGEVDRLKREHYVKETEGEFELESVTIIAEYIDPDQTYIDPATPCVFPNCALSSYTLNVTATVGGQSESREYEVQPRPGSQ